MILNDEECRTVYNDAMELPGRSAVSVTRAVEAAVIRKLAAWVSVEPETYLWEHNAGGMEPVLSRNSGPHPYLACCHRAVARLSAFQRHSLESASMQGACLTAGLLPRSSSEPESLCRQTARSTW